MLFRSRRLQRSLARFFGRIIRNSIGPYRDRICVSHFRAPFSPVTWRRFVSLMREQGRFPKK